MDSKEIILISILAVLVIMGVIGFLVMYFMIRRCRDAYEESSARSAEVFATVHETLAALSDSLSSYMRIGYTSNLRVMIQDLVSFEIERATKREIMIGKPVSALNFDTMLEKISKNVFESLNQDAINDNLSIYSREYIYKMIVEEVTIRLYITVQETQHLGKQDDSEESE